MDLADVLAAFATATRCEAAVWTQAEPGPPRREASTPDAPDAIDFAAVPAAGGRLTMPDGARVHVAPVTGPQRAWLVVGPCATDDQVDAYLTFLLPVVSQYLQASLEVEHAANELAERYEEINLLYTISEILGKTVALDEAARTILAEVSETVGARRGVILVHDSVTNTLRPVAVLGVPLADVAPIDIEDETTVSARVFRAQHGMLTEPGELENAIEAPFRRGIMLSVPIMWTAPRGAEPLGVVHLSDRRSAQPFSAGDQKLMAAIATQIGTAIQNTRLVRASLEQQRLAQEMQLAHELQMKLLPPIEMVAPLARVAARVVPADSVGGDFYNLVRLGNKVGVMIGDVSGHGYQAALIMALAMSASNIQAQRTADPGETMFSIWAAMRDELAMTEMFISGFYGIIDPRRGELRYANTGHPHAFIMGADGAPERLAATDPPIGMTETRPQTVRRGWNSAEEMLVLFTDGISDARNRAGARLGEERVIETIARHRDAEPSVILDHVFDMLDEHAAGAARRDDLTLVLLKS